MSEDLQLKLYTMLEQLAEKLGVASSKIWEWALTQVYVEAIQSIIYIIAIIIFCIGTGFLVKYVVTNYKSFCDKDVEMPWCLFTGIAVFASIGLIIRALSEIINIIQYTINPEYSAFQLIITELMKLK